MNAVRPRKSSLRIASPMPAIDICHPISSGALVASSTILRVARTATGALAHTRSARAMAASSAVVVGQHVDQPVVVGRLGGDRIARQPHSMARLNGILRPSRNSPPPRRPATA